MDDPGVHLVASGDRAEAVASLGDAVGLPAVLSDLNRKATMSRVPGRAARWGFTWDREDTHSTKWWPQGITTSADHSPSGLFEGRPVVCTSWYSHAGRGSRLTFTSLDSLRYRHVLLVDVSPSGDVSPVRVHAGGIVWHGDHLHVAGTSRGIVSFRLSDIVAAPPTGFHGYRYLLPVRFTYDAFTASSLEPLRYSFLSLAGDTLVAGEYGRRGRSTRLISYPLDPATSLLTASSGVARPLSLDADGLDGMQGATVVDGTWYVTTSAGRFLPGSLYVGRPGAFERHARVLPIGIEDIAYWPSRDQLWSLTEYPGRRYVFTMPRADFTPSAS